MGGRRLRHRRPRPSLLTSLGAGWPMAARPMAVRCPREPRPGRLHGCHRVRPSIGTSPASPTRRPRSSVIGSSVCGSSDHWPTAGSARRAMSTSKARFGIQPIERSLSWRSASATRRSRALPRASSSSCTRSVSWHADHDDGRPNQIANAARGLRFLQTGQWGSKPQALEWAEAVGYPAQDMIAALTEAIRGSS